MQLEIPEEIKNDVKFALKDMLYATRIRLSQPSKFINEYGYTKYAVEEIRMNLLEKLIENFD